MFNIGIVGAGPAGFFAAEALLAASPSLTVTLYDKLPTPFGLVRYGVAPDHHRIKTIVRSFNKIASNSRFQFVGDYQLGDEHTIDELLSLHDQVLLTIGTSGARPLKTKGDHLDNVVDAPSLVDWYNGHPMQRGHGVNWNAVEDVVIIGAGNVALDIARLLLKQPGELSTTDISHEAEQVLSASKVKTVTLVARRGPHHASFTPKELREILNMSEVNTVVDEGALLLEPSLQEWYAGHESKRTRKTLDLLSKIEARPNAKRRFQLKFRHSLTKINGQGAVSSVTLTKRQHTKEGWSLTNQNTTLPAQLVVAAIGYVSIPIEGIPFEENRIKNNDGRIAHRLWTAGWAKRGPSGVIGENRQCARDTVQRMLLEQQTLSPLNTPFPVPATFQWEQWEQLNAHERAGGEEAGKPRQKVLSIEEMRNIGKK